MNKGILIDNKIGHISVKPIKRKEGGNSCETSAYITGKDVYDERTGTTKRHGRDKNKGDVLHHERVGPKGQNWNSSQLWSASEIAGNKKNSITGRVIELQLPEETNLEEWIPLVRGYCLSIRDKNNLACEFAIHGPDKDKKGDAAKNYHVHIIVSNHEMELNPDRTAKLDKSGGPVFGKAGRKLNSRDGIEDLRAEWAKRLNSHLEKAGSNRRIDHRSFKRREESGDAPEQIAGAHRGQKFSAEIDKYQRSVRGAASAGEARPEAPQRVTEYYADESERKAYNKKKWDEWEAQKAEEWPTPPKPSGDEDGQGSGGRGAINSAVSSLLDTASQKAKRAAGTLLDSATQKAKTAATTVPSAAIVAPEQAKAAQAVERAETKEQKRLKREEQKRVKDAERDEDNRIRDEERSIEKAQNEEEKSEREWKTFWDKEARKAEAHKRKQQDIR